MPSVKLCAIIVAAIVWPASWALYFRRPIGIWLGKHVGRDQPRPPAPQMPPPFRFEREKPNDPA